MRNPLRQLTKQDRETQFEKNLENIEWFRFKHDLYSKVKEGASDRCVEIIVGSIGTVFYLVGMPTEGIIVTGVIYESFFNVARSIGERMSTKSKREEEKAKKKLEPFLNQTEELYRRDLPIEERFAAQKCLNWS